MNKAFDVHYKYLIQDVALITNNPAFDICSIINGIGHLYATMLGSNVYTYGGDSITFTVLYDNINGRQFPVNTMSIVGPDASQEPFSMRILLDYEESYKELKTAPSCDQAKFIPAVQTFLRAYNAINRYLHLFQFHMGNNIEEQLGSVITDLRRVNLYGGLIFENPVNNCGFGSSNNFEDAFPILGKYLLALSDLILDFNYEIITLLSADYAKLQTSLQDEGILALSHGVAYNTNKGSRVYDKVLFPTTTTINVSGCQ